MVNTSIISVNNEYVFSVKPNQLTKSLSIWFDFQIDFDAN